MAAGNAAPDLCSGELCGGDAPAAEQTRPNVEHSHPGDMQLGQGVPRRRANATVRRLMTRFKDHLEA